MRAITKTLILAHVVMGVPVAAAGQRLHAEVQRPAAEAAPARVQHVAVRKRIEGVIRETRSVAGRVYATVTVGTKDSLRRKMRLNIVSADGELLGHLTVTQVEEVEAVGVLSGPRVNEIRPNDRVTNRPAGEDDEGREQLTNT